MRRAEVLVIANDVVPGMGVPVAAPGLRASGIAAGLRHHGHNVTVAVNERIVRRVWSRGVPPPLPRGVVVVDDSTVGSVVRARRPKAVIATNSNYVAALGDLERTPLIYDFFAPKMLELAEQAAPDRRELELAQLRARKLAALRQSAGVIVNGGKKVPYVQEWIREAHGDPDALPTRVVNMPLRARKSSAPDGGPLRAVVTGYLQAWSRPGPWVDAVIPFLESGELDLHLLVNGHWGGRDEPELPESYHGLTRFGNVYPHALMEFDDFQRFLGTCHLSIDLFERNPERELAMVTRTAVAMASGIPVVHVPFTETSELVREYDAGWLVEADDRASVEGILRQAVDDRGALAAKRRGAEAVGRILDAKVATEPLHEMVEALS